MEQSRKLHNILQCFVDLNLETNENFQFDVNILSVSIENSFYSVDEGETLNFNVILQSPSINGIEELDVVLLNINTDILDYDGSEFPVRLKWEIGEQIKNLSLPINRDFLEEGIEQFKIGLTNLLNLKNGPVIQSSVDVRDRTILRSVGIRPIQNAQLDSTNTTNRLLRNGEENTEYGRRILEFNMIEGEELVIQVGLDKPSQYGIESIDVVFFNSTNSLNQALIESDFNLVGTSRLTWQIGEQFKEVKINSLVDAINEGVEKISLKLSNPDKVKIDTNFYSNASLYIEDRPNGRRFSTINMGNIYRQKGGSYLSGDIMQIRRIINGQSTSNVSDPWLIELGTYYTDNTINALRSDQVNYEKFPNYYFGIDENGNTEEVKLIITNQGSVDVSINDIVYLPGESFEMPLTRDSLSITLPSNDFFVPTGKFYNGEILSNTEGIYAESNYKLEILFDYPVFSGSNGVIYGTHGFELKNSNPINPKIYEMGDFNFKTFSTQFESQDNPLTLFSNYESVQTNFSNTCSDSFEGEEKIKNIKIKGLILLSNNGIETNYAGHNFVKIDQFQPICGVKTGSDSQNNWSSIPYEIIN